MVDFDLLNDISHKTSMLDVLDYYGIEYQNSSADRCKAVCPFHDDHSPSLIIYINNEHDKESFCCYVDNTAGDAFHFIRTMEGGDFWKAWAILCHINKIDNNQSEYVSELDRLLTPTIEREKKQSTNSINLQISTMYRDLLKQIKQQEIGNLKELEEIIDQRYQELDAFLSTNPSYVDLHSYFKTDLTRLKSIKQQYK